MKKPIRIKQWVKRLIGPTGACHRGQVQASRFDTPVEAWMKTNNPYELYWAVNNFGSEIDRQKLALIVRLWGTALRLKDHWANNPRLCRAIRADVRRPERFI